MVFRSIAIGYFKTNQSTTIITTNGALDGINVNTET